MAIIPSGQKFHTVAPGVDTQDRGSAKSNADREAYTMQDVIDTVGGGGGGGVSSLESLTGALNLAGAGTVTVTDNGSDTITITGSGETEGVDVSFVVRDTAYGSAGDHEGTVLTIGAVGALAQAHYWDGTGWVLANAGAVATADGLLCLGTSAAGDALVEGIMQLGTAPGSAGDVLYLDTTNGLLTNDVSGFTTGQIVRVCGYNLGSNRVYFKPSSDFIEVA